MNIYPKKRKKPHTGHEKLVLDVRPILQAKGIVNMYSYLKKVVGLPPTYCTQLCTGKAYRITNQYIEALCTTLNCTPNHLYQYNTPPTDTIGTNHALAALYKPTTAYKKLQEKLKGMSPEQMEEFYEGLEKEG